MGWGSGSSIAEEIINKVTKSKKFTDDQCEFIAATLINAFEDADCDTLDEVRNKIFQKVWQQMNGAEQ